MTGVSIAHHSVLALDQFAALVAQAGVRHIRIAAAAVDAFGVIRLRTLLEHQRLAVGAVVGAAGADDRTGLLAGLLDADGGTAAAGGSAVTIDAQAMAEHGNSLARLVAATSPFTTLSLTPDAWRNVSRRQTEQKSP